MNDRCCCELIDGRRQSDDGVLRFELHGATRGSISRRTLLSTEDMIVDLEIIE